jgi:hypothetical protein
MILNPPRIGTDTLNVMWGICPLTLLMTPGVTALMDLGAIGYLPGSEAIAETLAENSMKLIALKGVLEHHLNQKESLSLSDEAIHVMNLMDSLL